MKENFNSFRKLDHCFYLINYLLLLTKKLVLANFDIKYKYEFSLRVSFLF